MIRIIVFTTFFATAISSVGAQGIMVEAMIGNKNYWYQHGLSMKLADSKFGFFHSSSLHFLYDDEAGNELMSQSYITYPITSAIKVAAGTFYATKPGISPSLAMQLRLKHQDMTIVIVPRVDLKNNGSFEAMTLLEYTPPINEKVAFYSRAQLMSNYGPRNHNRSYQNIRMGFSFGQTTFGFALNVDERGKEKETQHNWGVFLRYDLLMQ